MNIGELTTEQERRPAVPILQQLWSDRAETEILDWTATDDYTLFGGFVDGDLVAVAGVLLTNHPHHERQAWLYDLVVDEPHREQGYGNELLRYVENWALEEECAAVALASPLAKEGVHEYYENRDYEKWGYVLEREL